MSVAPDQGPGTARPNTVTITRFERPTGRRRECAASVVELVLELGPSGDPDERRVASVALYGFRRDRSAAFELAGGGGRNAGERVETGTDDQLRSRARAVARSRSLAAALDQGIGATLPEGPAVIFDRLHESRQPGPHRCATLGIEQAIDAHDSSLGLAEVEIPAFIGTVRLGQSAGGVDAVLEVLRHRRELARIHRLGGFEQAAFFASHCSGPQVFSGPRHHRDVLVTEVAASKGSLRLWQSFQLFD